jgi:tRNA(Ile)-lysidine synthetase-like protein
MCTELVSKFKNEWFTNPNWWFNPTSEDDMYITINYEPLLDCNTIVDHLITVIMYDQLPRHIYRNQKANHIIEYFLQKALTIINNNSDENLSSIEWCFWNLPFRHTKNPRLILKIVEKAWFKLENSSDETDRQCIKSFIKASYSRCPVENQLDLIEKYNDENVSVFNAKEFTDVLDTQRTYNAITSTFAPAKLDRNEKVILSLSGGVDSMICSHLYKENIAAAVHINYMNRTECYREEEFIRVWCNSMQIPLYIRRIDEIRRQPCKDNDMRDIYETYTRNVRFATYKNVAQLCDMECKVVLGHNKDDCMENVFTNVANMCHYENLNGMSLRTSQAEIMFIRPLLNVSKESIRFHASVHNIPNLPNSTPSWSQRGKIRESVIPAIRQWNSNFEAGAFNLVETMSQLFSILEKTIEKDVKEYERNKCICWTHQSFPKQSLYWKELLYRLSNKRPPGKAVNHMIEKLTAFTISDKLEQCLVVINPTFQINFSKNNGHIRFNCFFG